jgi:UDP-N-acetylmuramoyl-tripeptide--D-alanyl-D-alanine ligase
MIPMTLPEIADVVRGAVHDDPAGVTVAGPAFMDSRVAERDGLFVALVGEQVDGHEYAEQAVAAGAAAVMATRPVGVPAVVVEEPLAALAALATHVVAALPELTVVGITGSQGKTSTKDLVAQLLADPSGGRRAMAAPHAEPSTGSAPRSPAVVATHGSFNNELGMPITALRADPTTRILVLEMGARGVGHIAELCRVAPPDVALVLNVGKAHMSEFGSQEAIARAKGELVEALGPDGVAVLNADDPLVAAMARRTSARVLTFGESAEADLRVAQLDLDPGGRPTFDLVTATDAVHVELPLVGEHQAANAAAAAAVATALGVGLHEVAGRLATVTSASRWRMEVHERSDGVVIVNDAYNANPDSMRAALKALAALGRGRGPGTRTVAVLGEMLELGESSREEHDALGRLAVRLDVNQLVVVGEGARPIHLGACLEGSWGAESVFVPDNDAAAAWLDDHLAPGDVVLLKASRAAALERVAEALVEEVNGP